MPNETYWLPMDDKYRDLHEKLGEAALSKEAFPALETLEVINEETIEIWYFYRGMHELWNAVNVQ